VLPGWFWARLLVPTSSDRAERLAYSLALSMALVPAVALLPTRLFGMGVTLAVASPLIVFFVGLAAYLRFGAAKGSEEPLFSASSFSVLRAPALVLLAVAFGIALGVVVGVVPGVPIRPLVTVGVVPDMWVVLAIALLVFFAGLVHLVEPRREPESHLPEQELQGDRTSPSVVLAQRLLLPAVLLLALLRGYLGPVLHDWPFIRGVDHYSHAVMAELVMTEGKIEPYLIYPPGFHTLTAIICRLTGLAPLEVFPALAPALLLLPTLALYTLARRLWGWEYGVIAALFSVLLGGTYYYYNDAMYPNLASSQFLIVLAVAALIGVYVSPSVRGGLLLALLGSSTVLYHQIASYSLAVLLALVGIFFLPYLLIRDRRRGLALLCSLALLGFLSVLYAWDTYNLPQAIAGLLSGSRSSSTGAAVNMAIGTQPPYSLGSLAGTMVSQPVAWLGLLGALLVAGELLVVRRRLGAPQTLAYLTLLLWTLLLFLGSRTSLSGFPDRFERDLGIPLAVLGAFAFVALLRPLRQRKPAAFVALVVVLLAGTLVGMQAVRNLEQAAGPSPRLKDRPPPPAVVAAGAWLEEHNRGGSIVATPYLAYVPSRGMLAMGDYTGMQSYDAARIRRGRDLPPFGAGPLWDALWVLQHPEGERTQRIMEENDVRYLVFHKRYLTIDWRAFERRDELYRIAFENESVIIFEPR
jgi:hypothetical protein